MYTQYTHTITMIESNGALISLSSTTSLLLFLTFEAHLLLLVCVEEDDDHDDEEDQECDDDPDDVSHVHRILDRQTHRVPVRAVGVLHVQEVPPGVLGTDLLDQEPGKVAVFPLGVLDHLLGQIPPVEVLTGLNPEVVLPVPGHPGRDGVGADVHLQTDVATADGFDGLGNVVAEHLGSA